MVATTFSLICTGLMTTISASLPENPKTATGTYQVDLNTSEWCVDSCGTIFKIKEASDSMLTLSGGETGYLMQINRVTGGFVSVLLSDGFAMKSKGSCKAGAFKGLPRRQF